MGVRLSGWGWLHCNSRGAGIFFGASSHPTTQLTVNYANLPVYVREA